MATKKKRPTITSLSAEVEQLKLELARYKPKTLRVVRTGEVEWSYNPHTETLWWRYHRDNNLNLDNWKLSKMDKTKFLAILGLIGSPYEK